MFKKKQPAVTMAYKIVRKNLKYKPSMLVKRFPDVTYTTLRRIEEGRPGKASTDKYYLQIFLRLMNEEYYRLIQNGGDGASNILKRIKEICFVVLEVE